MKILMLLSKEWGESRSRREAAALVQAGHSVRVVARNRNREARLARSGRVVLCRIPSFRALGRGFAQVASVPLPINPVWRLTVNRFARRWRPDVIHVHDLPLTPLAIALGHELGARVVFDLHENYPAMMEVRGGGPIRRLANHLRGWRELERRVAKQTDALLVVCDEQRERLERLGVDSRRIHVVGNTIEPEVLDQALAQSRTLEPPPLPPLPGLRVIYTGLFGRDRGLDVLIRALAIAVGHGADLSLLMVGDGMGMAQLRQLAAELQITARVAFTGWIPYQQAFALIADSTIAVIPHRADEHVNTTYPNKLFEFMGLSKPLVVSDALPLHRIVVRECGAGLSAPSGDAEAFAGALERLAADPALREQLGRAGRRAVEGPYDFARDRARLLAMYDSLGRERPA
ncbi:MAG: glycosyltransferase family 4 protein [Planctomycetota bacterium]